MHKTNLLTVSEVIQTAAYEADNFANTLEHDAPAAAVFVLDKLDAVAGCTSFADLMSQDAVAKLTGAARYCRQTFPRFSLGHESADNLARAAASLAARAASALPY
ncbi:hypothetical protein UFOVP1370_19 [uncultured Caudovirales phage]|uniref:Uncharacterized protein n=1 Tax=uncultured Caudovirales phage TaxID=2100421 RepID=A0A6J5S4N5_9CAUD|nr:hypothetical protein UFOVP1370_19 [uncultured Caudovirales phage]